MFLSHVAVVSAIASETAYRESMLAMLSFMVVGLCVDRSGYDHAPLDFDAAIRAPASLRFGTGGIPRRIGAA